MSKRPGSSCPTTTSPLSTGRRAKPPDRRGSARIGPRSARRSSGQGRSRGETAQRLFSIQLMQSRKHPGRLGPDDFCPVASRSRSICSRSGFAPPLSGCMLRRNLPDIDDRGGRHARQWCIARADSVRFANRRYGPVCNRMQKFLANVCNADTMRRSKCRETSPAPRRGIEKSVSGPCLSAGPSGGTMAIERTMQRSRFGAEGSVPLSVAVRLS
jgi:hypothetical protein